MQRDPCLQTVKIPLTGAAAALALAALAACNTPTTREDVKQAHEVAQDTEREYVRDRALYVADLLDERMNDLNGRIATAKTLCGDLAGQSAIECNDVMKALQGRRDALGARASYLRENADAMARMAVDQEWQTIEAELASITEMLDSLEETASPEGRDETEGTEQEGYEQEGTQGIPDDEPMGTEPMGTEPMGTDPMTDPMGTEPMGTEPMETEPMETEPMETEPMETEPMETEPTESDPFGTAPSEAQPPADDEEKPDETDDSDLYDIAPDDDMR